MGTGFRGSFTVEAAFIFPIVLILVFFVLKTGLYLHDEAVLEVTLMRVQELGEMAQRHPSNVQSGRPNYEMLLSQGRMDGVKIELCAKENYLKPLSEELLFCRVSDFSVQLHHKLFGEELCLQNEKGERRIVLFYPAEKKRRRTLIDTNGI